MTTTTPPLPKLAWPGARLYSSVVALILSIQFIKALVQAIERHSVFPRDGSATWHAIGYVAEGYLWVTILFWAAALGFMAAKKGG